MWQKDSRLDILGRFIHLEEKESRIDLSTGEAEAPREPDEEIPLLELIKILNDRLDTDFTEADQLFFDQIQQEALESDHLRQAVEAITEGDFKFFFKKVFEGLVIGRIEGNEEIFGKLMSDGEMSPGERRDLGSP